MRISLFFFFFFVDWNLCSGLHSGKAGTWKAGALVHFALFILEIESHNFLPGLASSHDTPNLSFPDS
jgi:hypothetical protein